MRRGAPLLVLALIAGCTSAEGEPSRGRSPVALSPVELAAPGGFRVAVEHTEAPSGGLLAWESHWVLTWDRVPGAEAYDIWFGTSEGGASGPRRTTDEPRLRLQAAAGTSPPDRLEQDRAAGLLFTSSQLSVAVSARAGGTTGPLSPYVPVGDVPPDGVPLPTRAGHDHADDVGH